MAPYRSSWLALACLMATLLITLGWTSHPTDLRPSVFDLPQRMESIHREIRPNLVSQGVAWVSEQNTEYDTRHGVFRSFFAFGEQVRPAISAARRRSTERRAGSPRLSAEPVIVGHGEVGRLLRQWFREGTAAGNRGDLYDNHDADHSNLRYQDFPHLSRIEFVAEARANQLHIGLQTRLFYNAVTFGNSSMSLVSGPYWRSQPRLAYTQPRLVAMLYAQYVRNHVYVYPEHRDHDPGDNGNGGYGDLYCTNTPYMIISQGSSGSDQPFLESAACTLAAFRPEVKRLLKESGTLMPAFQMILRSSNTQVRTPEDYLTGPAHPSVFRGDQLDVLKMVHAAHALRRQQVPPVIMLRVVQEELGVVGRDYFDVAPREQWFDSPSAIARIVRSTRYERRMIVSAEASYDLNQRPLTWHWRVLRGDADRIKIRPLNEASSLVELLVPYHVRRPVTPGSDLESNRVDIGAFVHNGDYYSAPAFVTFYYLGNEIRVYDQRNRIQSVTYGEPDRGGSYTDPLIDLPKNWRDEYHYDRAGQLVGWTRHRGSRQEAFTADGALVIRRDELGRAIEARTVKYVAEPRESRPPILDQQPDDTILYYECGKWKVKTAGTN